MLVEAVSQILDFQPREVQEIINNLTNGGVVVVSESRLAVYPDTLRHALIGDVFFDSPQALSGRDQLITYSSIADRCSQFDNWSGC